ncbi:MAG: hypothetical protein VX871_04025, partial [Pseudomonadota bacterium]|nr:hypothetical protein [Pseudomonadota bacterium]
PRRAGAAALTGLLAVWAATQGVPTGAQENFLSTYMPYGAFDRLPHERLPVRGGVLRVGFAPGDLKLPKDRLLAWAAHSAEAVAVYFGRFPVGSARLLVVPVPGKGVNGGQAFGHRGAAIRVQVGQFTGEQDLTHDWKMVHEMIHLSTPRMADRHDWLTEGIAVYVESIARVQAGHLPPEQIWGDFLRDMPQGLPGFGDRGLDNTPTWGRTYWGGAIFCLLADIAIRERTGNARGLQDALRGVVDAGGSNEGTWSIERFIDVADKATGVTALRELYETMGDRSVPTDLEALWRRLGVAEMDGRIVFDDDAELAHVRRRLTVRPVEQIRG